MWKEYKRGDLGTDGKCVPKPNEALIRKMLNELKKDKYPWMYDVTKCAPQQAIKNLGRAFERWWKKLGKRPKHHSKRKHNSFYIENSHVTLDNEARTVKIPNMESLVHLKERLRFKGRILSTTIFLQAGRWFMSFAVEVEQTILPRSSSYAGFAVPAEENQTAGSASAYNGAVGLDLGITTLATLSNGEKFEGPRALKRYLKKLKRLSRAFSRKKKKEYLRSRPEESDGRVTNIPQPGNHLPTKTINSDTISLCAFFILAKVISFLAMNFYVRSIILLEGHHHIKQKTVQVSFS